jgi:hypothetical protein
MQRVRDALGIQGGRVTDAAFDVAYRELTDPASNKVWPRRMWQWGLDSGAEWFLTVQDDTLPAPCFWRALPAMLMHVGPNAVLGLSAVHPIGPEIARQGHRWYCTQSWVIGWGYAMRRTDLAEFLAWCDARPQLVAERNEDDLINIWVHDTCRLTWHPVPSILDHDTSIDSTYDNDRHAHRRSSVTWRDFGEGSLCSEDFWLPSGTPQILPVPAPKHCWFCLQRKAHAASHLTGAAMCRHCLSQMAAEVIRA